MSMNWPKLYDLERVLSARWGYGDLSFIRDTVKTYTRKIQSMEESIIIFPEFQDTEIYIFGIDTVHMITQEFRTDPSTKWYDFKSHSSGLKYEYAMSIREPKIIWRNGPFPASFHDITIFRGGNLTNQKSLGRGIHFISKWRSLFPTRRQLETVLMKVNQKKFL